MSHDWIKQGNWVCWVSCEKCFKVSLLPLSWLSSNPMAVSHRQLTLLLPYVWSGQWLWLRAAEELPEWSQDLLVSSLDEATSEVTGRSWGQKRHQVTEQSPPGLVKRKVVLIIRQKAGLAKCSKRMHDSRFDKSRWRNIKQGEQKCSRKQNLK